MTKAQIAIPDLTQREPASNRVPPFGRLRRETSSPIQPESLSLQSLSRRPIAAESKPEPTREARRTNNIDAKHHCICAKTAPRYCISREALNAPTATFISPLRDAEEFEVLLLEQRDGVADVLREDRLEHRAERGVRVSAREVRLGHVRDRRARVVEHRGPLLDLLPEVLRVERGVTMDGYVSACSSGTIDVREKNVHGAVPDLHLRARAGVARERVVHLLSLYHPFVRNSVIRAHTIGYSPTAGQSRSSRRSSTASSSCRRAVRGRRSSRRRHRSRRCPP